MLYNLKNLFVAVSCETEWTDASSAVAYGLSLARAASARLTVQSGAQQLMLPASRMSDMVVALVREENERLRATATRVADDARAAAELSGVHCRTEVELLPHGQLVDRFVAEARVHDLTIVDGESSALSPDRVFIEAALFQSGRPLLIVPEGFPTFKGERVVVAWDGSARAARALNDAMPILRGAASVQLVSVVGEKDLSTSVAGVELGPHLAAHGVNFEVVTTRAVNGDVAEALKVHAVGAGADLMVMGAYVHSRLRQLVLGGCTNSLLRSTPVPLFLSY
ncbi:universal stress protein [Xanthobacteraceae bacterium A53D]